jgi:hypothetical protein
MHRYSLAAETSVFSNQTPNYAWFMLLLCLGCDALGYMASLPVLSGALLMGIVYVWAQVNSQDKVSFMFGLRYIHTSYN